MSVLSIGELLDIGGSASTAGLVPYSALEYNSNNEISAISGSAIAGGGSVDSATVSSIASSYAESAVSSVVDTVSSNSASWGGYTGDFVEKSAINVTIGDSNSADGVALAQGSSNSAYGGSLAQGYNNRAYLISLAQGEGNSAWSNSFAQGSFNTAVAHSFAQGAGNFADRSSFVHGIYVSAKDCAAVFGRCNLSGDGDTSSGNSAAFAIGDGTGTAARHDLMLVTQNGEITMYSGTADTTGIGLVSSIRDLSSTVSSNSASWGGGGVDSATVSSIASSIASSVASSYAVSAASSKADSSALSSYALSADVSSCINTVSSNSASWISSISALSAMVTAMSAAITENKYTLSAGAGISITNDTATMTTTISQV